MKKPKPNALKIDLSSFDQKNDDRTKIADAELWVPCRICVSAFRRVRLTARFCGTCNQAFCEGEHGTFAPGKGPARCIVCGAKDEEKKAKARQSASI